MTQMASTTGGPYLVDFIYIIFVCCAYVPPELKQLKKAKQANKNLPFT